jgi:hypothetical protein
MSVPTFRLNVGTKPVQLCVLFYNRTIVISAMHNPNTVAELILQSHQLRAQVTLANPG